MTHGQKDAMTSRERWTVYPLLFLALGLAVQAIVVPSGEFLAARVDDLACIRLTCEEIVVVGEDGEVLVHLGREAVGEGNEATAGGGRIEIHDAEGTLTLALSGSEPEAAAEE